MKQHWMRSLHCRYGSCEGKQEGRCTENHHNILTNGPKCQYKDLHTRCASKPEQVLGEWTSMMSEI